MSEEQQHDVVIELSQPIALDDARLAQILEAALMVAGRPLTLADMSALFEEYERPSPTALERVLHRIMAECTTRGVDLKEVASGWRFQAKQDFSVYLSRLWEEKPSKYTRATLETLALIAYRQPITRGEIEEIRGVTVNTQTIKSLLEREWIRVVGHRDVPGRPSLYATTRQFLDYFNLKSLDQLPSLSELKDLDSLNVELDFEEARQSVPRAEPVPDAALEKAVARMEQEQALEQALDESGVPQNLLEPGAGEAMLVQVARPFAEEQADDASGVARDPSPNARNEHDQNEHARNEHDQSEHDQSSHPARATDAESGDPEADAPPIDPLLPPGSSSVH